LKQCNHIHDSKYEYDISAIGKGKEKVSFKCKKHGWQSQLLADHLNGSGCKWCAASDRGEEISLGKNEILKRFEAANTDSFEYVIPENPRLKTVIQVKCKKHGWFDQVVASHMNGSGCPSCCHSVSKPELEIIDFIKTIVGEGEEIITSDRKILGGLELDIYLPERGLAVEFNGLYWHSDRVKQDKDYHKKKYAGCKAAGIHLVSIFEDEWLHTPEKVKAALSSLLGKRIKGPSARQCTVERLENREAIDFTNLYHLQGKCAASHHYGLRDRDGNLVAVMSFGHPSRQSQQYSWELKRFVTDGKTHAGAASKLLKAFQRENGFPTIASFSDRRWFTGGMYAALGFEHDGEIKPDYSYIKGNKRFHKANFKRKLIREKLPEFYSEDLTEKQMMENAKYSRIWDCGKDRWLLKAA